MQTTVQQSYRVTPISGTSTATAPLPKLAVGRRYPIAALLIFLTDLFSLVISQVISLQLVNTFNLSLPSNTLQMSIPLIGLLLIGYRFAKLYPGVMYHPVEEIRKFSSVTSLIYAAILVTTASFHLAQGAFLLFIGSSWFFSLFTLPLNRSALRKVFASKPWWGYPVVILGSGKTGQEVTRRLKQNPEFGLKPVAILDDAAQTEEIEGIPVWTPLSRAHLLALKYHIRHVILAMPEIDKEEQAYLIDHYARYFAHIILIPDVPEFSNLWQTTRDLNGLFGLTLEQPHLNRDALLFKRAFDIILTTILLILLAPLLALIALAVKLTSQGKILHTQDRLGKDKKCFCNYKFRSMYSNAEELLEEILKENPELRKEYETFHKLKHDPRITPVGRILRRFSLDELPQLFNVIKGDLSLVGPRAYMPKELPDMEGLEHQILRVRPGITGLWQVSGRNQLTFKTRLYMDVYYIKNWSVWLDIYLLFRTIPVVLTGRGAR